MKGGYDSFFKAANQAAGKSAGTRSTSKASGQASSKAKAQFKMAASKAKSSDEINLSEAELRKMFKMTPAKKKGKKHPIPVPWTGLTVSFLALLLSGFYLVSPETFEDLYDRVEFRMTTSASAAEDGEKNSSPKGDNAENSAAASASTTSVESKEPVQQDLSYISKLSERKKQLDAREEQLNELEEELHRQRAEVEVQIKRLEDMRRQIASVLNERVQIDDEKVNKLVEVYSNMKPKQAAEIIATLNEDLAVEVMGRMKKKDAAAILNLIEAKKAQVLSEKYTGYKTR